MPLLDQFLPADGLQSRGVLFVPDKAMQAMLMSETRNDVVTMLPSASNDVVGNADIQSSVRAVREEVDVEMAIHPAGGDER